MFKNYTKYALLVLSLCTSACTTESVVGNEMDIMEDAEITEIEAVVAPFDLDGWDSRTAINMGSSSIENPVWAENDTIGIYPATGDQLSFPIVDGVGTSTCIFNGGGWALKTSTAYIAYSPFNRDYYYMQNDALPISMLGQKQVGNNNSAHLGAYDIQIAKGTTPSSGKISFSFYHQVAIVRMDLTAPVATEWSSIRLESNASFTTESMMNLSLKYPQIEATSTSNFVQLDLENVTTTDENMTITAYMMMLPVDLTNKSFIVKLKDKDGNIYSSVAKITNENKNFKAASARWITAQTFVKQNPPTYNWYNPYYSGYTLTKDSDFMGFAKLANGDKDALAEVGATSVDFTSKTIYLNADIDLSNYCNENVGSWIPVNFSGTFDGKGHIIKNLYGNESRNMGLFNSLSNATVKNLTVEGGISRPNDAGGSYYDFAGLAIGVSSSIIENCIVNVNIKTEGSNDSYTCGFGGLCYSAYKSTFIACQSGGDISIDTYPLDASGWIGGLVGRSEACNYIACCKLNGSVIIPRGGVEYSLVGGLVGGVSKSKGNYNACKLRACYTHSDAISGYGRQYGYIVGGIGSGYYREGELDAEACFYSGKNYRGIGGNNYTGNLDSYDSGTAYSEDLSATVEAMNAAITTWNVNNPDKVCNYRYIINNNSVELVSK